MDSRTIQEGKAAGHGIHEDVRMRERDSKDERPVKLEYLVCEGRK